MIRSLFSSRMAAFASVMGASTLAATHWMANDKKSSTKPQELFVARAGSDTKKAVCVLQSDNNTGVQGVVTFTQTSGGPTEIKADIKGLNDGAHGFHIYEYGNLTRGFHTAGDHYNPFKREHGGPNDDNRHLGDLGNVTSRNSVASFQATDRSLQLDGPHSIIGRACVVHISPDDFGRGRGPDSMSNGNAGPAAACGVIGIDKVDWPTSVMQTISRTLDPNAPDRRGDTVTPPGTAPGVPGAADTP